MVGCLWMAACPDAALEGAKEGLALWAGSVVPALFPFFAGVNFLTALGLPYKLGKAFEPFFRSAFCVPGEGAFFFLSSLFSGYPVGARLVGDARRQGRITREEGEKLLAFCSTSGPLFLLGTVGSSLLGNSKLGLTVALCHYGGALLNGLLWRGKIGGFGAECRRENRAQKGDFSMGGTHFQAGLLAVFTDSLLAAVRSVILVGCYVVLFSMAVKAIPLTGTAGLWVKGLLEMTVGCAAAVKEVPDPVTAALLCCFFTSFGGISIYLQSVSFLGETDLSKGKFLVQKVTHGILAAGLSVLVLRFLL